MNTRTANTRSSKPVVFTLAAAGLCTLLAASPAQAQSLSDRIGHVMNQRARAQQTNETKGRMLGTLLYTDLTIQFTDTPAREVFDYLKTALGVNIIARYNDDRTGIGLDPDESINLDVVDESALTVLEMILDQCAGDLDETAWQLRDGFVEVGTKERLAAKNSQEIRYYPVRDLLFEPPHFDNAPDLDLDSALSQGGSQGGGGGGGSGGGGGFGGGGGSGGGGGGGSGGGGGGGSLFGDPGDEAERPTELEQAEALVQLITEIVEPEGWIDNGGDWGTIRYYQGTLIIRAPDFMHRQIGGYPFPIRPGSARGAMSVQDRRFVTFTGGFSQVSLVGLRQQPFGGAAGGGPP